jgi:hypothetical protein
MLQRRGKNRQGCRTGGESIAKGSGPTTAVYARSVDLHSKAAGNVRRPAALPFPHTMQLGTNTLWGSRIGLGLRSNRESLSPARWPRYGPLVATCNLRAAKTRARAAVGGTQNVTVGPVTTHTHFTDWIVSFLCVCESRLDRG